MGHTPIATKLLLKDLLFLSDEQHSLLLPLRLDPLLVLASLRLQRLESLLLERFFKIELLLLLLSKEGQLLLHLHTSEESLLLLLLADLLLVLSTHAVEGDTSFLGLIQLVQHSLLLSCGHTEKNIN